jgi:hypothetical protein
VHGGECGVGSGVLHGECELLVYIGECGLPWWLGACAWECGAPGVHEECVWCAWEWAHGWVWALVV